MKINSTKKVFINIILYTVIAVAIYYLYAPLNKNANNKTSSAIQFVYQQF